MSFTAEVKDELSRVEGECPDCAIAQLSALIHVCGSLSFSGSGSYAIRIATETGAVARTLVKLTHDILDLETLLTVRRSRLHKTRNYLIEIPAQRGLEAALIRMGIIEPDGGGRSLVAGISPRIVRRDCCKRAYLRGAFMGGGFIADPRGDFHLEIAVSTKELADALIELASEVGVGARLNHRRGTWAVYLKSFDDINYLLGAMGATRSVLAVENVRVMKSVKSDVNRLVNAELANQARSTGAAADQLALIRDVEREIGFQNLPPALERFCRLRRAHPELSLRDLGELSDPPVSKSALYHRILRLQALLDDVRGSGRDS
ncbi:MAG: DNA-binding protein WhiA [Atopobiaceae bacterium]|nr:DNA-binding protein WhiA [Atopobiaceae bacterium]